jgi:hypothetical protein
MADELLVARLRSNLGDVNSPAAFSDAELALLLDQHGGDELAARVDGLWRLTTQAAKLHSYTVGLSREEKGEIFDHLLALHEQANADLGKQRAADLTAFREAGVPSAAVPVQHVF